MLLRSEILTGIRDGSITLAFRRWTRPTVRTGGTLMTYLGQLQIVSVIPVEEGQLNEEDARRAGYASRDDLLLDLNKRQEGGIYRVEFGGVTPDPRVALREAVPSEEELQTILEQLRKLDERTPSGPWTAAVLHLISQQSGVLAQTLASRLGMEKLDFKGRVRKLKALGLTISLEVGYRLSPRGETVLSRIAR